jgi:nucleotide-binding universal stress UspA family protein
MQPTILVPLDGSARAEAILPTAVAMAQATHSSLSLLHVVVSESTTGIHAASHRQWVDARTPACTYLESIAARVLQARVPVGVEVLVGHAATRIVQATRQDPRISLIAMATHGRGGLPRAVFGSIAEEVLRSVAVPVLLVRDEQPAVPPLTAGCTILVPLDGSAFARQALGTAQMLGRAFGATLLLAAVVPAREPADPPQLAPASPWRNEAQHRETDRLMFELDKTARQLEAAGAPVRRQLLHGKPGEALIAHAGTATAALIVMATHGRSGIDQLRWGSVALEVLRHTPAPVVLLGPHQPTAPSEYTWDPDYVMNAL